MIHPVWRIDLSAPSLIISDMPSRPYPSGSHHDVRVQRQLVQENSFRNTWDYRTPLPDFETAKEKQLPVPEWEGHPEVIDCYWGTWKLAWRNIRVPNMENKFLAPYMGTAFNGAVFLWDSSFIVQFADYARHAVPFIRTLECFYTKQHEDGYICREISETTGLDRWEKHRPRATGPNILAWAEWLHYQRSGDVGRLEKVFPALLAYHRWMRLHRSWPDGSYWSCNLATGMDNQPRFDDEPALRIDHHSYMTWIDACAHALLSAETLNKMAEIIGREQETTDLEQEARFLRHFIDNQLWNDSIAFYCDRKRDGTLLNLKSIGAYWLLLTGAVPAERLPLFLANLTDETEFNRPHRVPSISASSPEYSPTGDYWQGAVWCPTNYMVLRGLEHRGEQALAHDIGRNHLENVVEVWQKTGSLWENYAPEFASPGTPAHADFVGWTGVAPIAVLFEQVFGIRPDIPANRLTLDVRLQDAYQVQRYPFGDHLLDLRIERRERSDAKPTVTLKTTTSLILELHWPGGTETRQVTPD